MDLTDESLQVARQRILARPMADGLIVLQAAQSPQQVRRSPAPAISISAPRQKRMLLQNGKDKSIERADGKTSHCTNAFFVLFFCIFFFFPSPMSKTSLRRAVALSRGPSSE